MSGRIYMPSNDFLKEQEGHCFRFLIANENDFERSPVLQHIVKVGQESTEIRKLSKEGFLHATINNSRFADYMFKEHIPSFVFEEELLNFKMGKFLYTDE